MNLKQNRLGLVVTAAGSSTRFGADKLFLSIKGSPLIRHTLQCFAHLDLAQIVVTFNPNQKIAMESALKGLALSCPITFIEGGKTRKESVENAVKKMEQCDGVLIHDGARPFVSAEMIDRIIEAGTQNKAVIPGLKITDTVKWVENGRVIKTVDRNFLVRVQTPQLFETKMLLQAYEASSDNATDESMVVEAYGVDVIVVDGDTSNIKVTYPEDVSTFLS